MGKNVRQNKHRPPAKATPKMYVSVGLALVVMLAAASGMLLWQRLQLNQSKSCTPDPGTGWLHCPETKLAGLHRAKCSVERFTMEQWQEQPIQAVLNRTEPAIISGATVGWPALQRWRRRDLVDEYGTLEVRCLSEADIDVGTDGSKEVKLCTLGEYEQLLAKRAADGVGNDSPQDFIFDRKSNLLPQLFADVRVPRPFEGLDTWDHMTLSMGGIGQGVQIHCHPEAWNALVFGRKRWILIPYDKMYDWHERKRFVYDKFKRKVPVGTFFRERLGDINVQAFMQHTTGVHDCIQQAGEMIWIPRVYHHITINLDETIAIVGERGGSGSLSPDEYADLWRANWRPDGGRINDPADPFFSVLTNPGLEALPIARLLASLLIKRHIARLQCSSPLILLLSGGSWEEDNKAPRTAVRQRLNQCST